MPFASRIPPTLPVIDNSHYSPHRSPQHIHAFSNLNYAEVSSNHKNSVQFFNSPRAPPLPPLLWVQLLIQFLFACLQSTLSYKVQYYKETTSHQITTIDILTLNGLRAFLWVSASLYKGILVEVKIYRKKVRQHFIARKLNSFQ